MTLYAVQIYISCLSPPPSLRLTLTFSLSSSPLFLSSSPPFLSYQVMLDLLHCAASKLYIGGRLSYLMPASYDFGVDDLPKHPALRLLEMCEQGLSTRHAR